MRFLLDGKQRLPHPLSAEVGALERAALTLLGAIIAQLLATASYSPAWLVFGIAIGHLWSTFPWPSGSGSEVLVLPADTAPPDAHAADGSIADVTSDNASVADVSPDDNFELPFTPLAGAQSLGANEYSLDYPLDTVIAATLSKFDVLPCPDEPEMLKMEVLSKVEVAPGVIRRKRVSTRKNTLPSAIASFMGVGPTVLTDEESLEKTGDRMIFISENREMQDIVHAQVYELLQVDPGDPSRTLIMSETWIATPGLYWPLTTTVISFAKSKAAETIPKARRLLEKRCAELLAEEAT